MHSVGQGAASLAQLARVLQAAQNELQRGKLVQQQRQALAARVQRLMQPDLLRTVSDRSATSAWYDQCARALNTGKSTHTFTYLTLRLTANPVRRHLAG